MFYQPNHDFFIVLYSMQCIQSEHIAVVSFYDVIGMKYFWFSDWKDFLKLFSFLLHFLTYLSVVLMVTFLKYIIVNSNWSAHCLHNNTIV